MSSHREKPARLPFVVPLLALGTFVMVTSEFIIAALLPEVSADLGVSVSTAGLLITAFAVGMIVGAPTISIATLRLPRRSTLVLALVVFAVGHVIAALSSSFTIVLAARVIIALATGTFISVGSVVATSAAGPAAASRAMGVMMSGMSLAIVAGVPLGSWVGQVIGWRGTFWTLAALAGVAALVIGRFIPAAERAEVTPSVRSQLAVLRHGRMWLILAATALVTGGFMAAYSYISPLLTERTGISEGAVPLVLVGFGVGALLGTNITGRLGDRKPLATFITTSVASLLVLLLLIPLSTSPVATVVLVVLLGVTGLGITSIATPLAVRFGHSSPALAAALTVSAFNLGIALVSWLAGTTLDTSLGVTGPEVVGAVMAGLGLIPLLVLAAIRATRTAAPQVSLPADEETSHKAQAHREAA
ncbi:MFS transporter [Streptomyces bobili]|uniref:MFS transporter n=1 Tax=Streptomyces bobili TaxID=67280 RepID=UPI0022505D7A|nr:MFS transporter [Streptomyces bobili]MCX5521366.1 MFS transporter [Streptomyces bobili]